jgi:small subunit ribosomal protein S6
VVNLYEVTYLVRPDLDDEALAAVNNRVNERLSSLGGELLRSEGWGRRRLAYPIDHHDDAFYVTSVFRMPGQNVKQLENQLKLMPDVLRFLVIRQKESDINLAGPLIPQTATRAVPEAAPSATEEAAVVAVSATPSPAPTGETTLGEETVAAEIEGESKPFSEVTGGEPVVASELETIAEPVAPVEDVETLPTPLTEAATEAVAPAVEAEAATPAVEIGAEDTASTTATEPMVKAPQTVAMAPKDAVGELSSNNEEPTSDKRTEP